MVGWMVGQADGRTGTNGATANQVSDTTPTTPTPTPTLSTTSQNNNHVKLTKYAIHEIDID